ncbi:MAG: TIGR03943 family protein [Desulfosporosinus sp.]|nr:TIGR03943 family protein [Desulfosporosinus sp.]
MKIQRGFPLVQSLILSCFSLMLIHLIMTGTIVLYISPKLIWLSKFSAILLVIMALAKLVALPHNHSMAHNCCNHDHACGSAHHNHSHPTKGLLQMAIFIIPLILGFVMQPRVLASTALSNSINTAGPVPYYAMHIPKSDKFSNTVQWPSGLFVKKNAPSSAVAQGTNNASINLLNKSNPQNKLNLVKPLTPESVSSTVKETDLMQLYLNIDDHPEQIYNHHWQLTGFVYKDPTLAKNQFVISRFVMTCCIVDATPIGIIVESSDAPNLKADTWIEVDGLLQKRTLDGVVDIKSVQNFHETEDGIPYLLATRCKVVATPKDPYLAPPLQ